MTHHQLVDQLLGFERHSLCQQVLKLSHCCCTGAAQGVSAAGAARVWGSVRSSASSGSRQSHAVEDGKSKAAGYFIRANACNDSSEGSMEQPADGKWLDRHAYLQVRQDLNFVSLCARRAVLHWATLLMSSLQSSCMHAQRHPFVPNA